MIAVLDYGAGNLTSVGKALRAVGAEFIVARSTADLDGAAGIIVPGVGHFGATRSIDREMRDTLRRHAGQRPLLGVCLGLQYLFERSDEAPGEDGLALLSGNCFVLPPTEKVPHVGWNTVEIVRPSAILRGLPDDASFYFTHSYAAPITEACVGRTSYTAPFAAVVEKGQVFGVQFHPEKSGDAGLAVLQNFVQICGA